MIGTEAETERPAPQAPQSRSRSPSRRQPLGPGDGVIGDSIPFDSLSAGTETETGAGTGDCVICDAILFDSLAAGTEAGTEEPTPQSPTIPISTPIAIPPSGASRLRRPPHIFFLTSWASRSSPPAPASDKFSTMDSVSVTTR